MSKRSVNPNCVSMPFDTVAACDKSVFDVLFETEERMLEREKNERDVLGEYKCETGMSVEDVLT